MALLPGAVGGAFLASEVSLAGLLITSELRLCKFRSRWIDARLDDAALLITYLAELCAAVRAELDEGEGHRR
jgi:hypothetical protein